MDRFLIEMIRRWGADQPWFFKTVSILGLIVALITGLPGILDSIEASVCELDPQLCFEIQLPAAWDAIYSKVASIASLVGSLVAKFASTSEEKAERSILDA